MDFLNERYLSFVFCLGLIVRKFSLLEKGKKGDVVF